MNEVTRVVLENEMDLILAHKQSMRLAELTGLSLASQTTFATAVSEVSRSAISTEGNTELILSVSDKRDKLKLIIATLADKRRNFNSETDEGYIYARRLVQNIQTTTGENGNITELSFRMPPATRIDDLNLEKWRIQLNTDPAVSPYEEIKRKNKQLIELADRLRASERQYKELTDSLPIMIFTTNDEGRIIFANKWVEEYTGETVDALNENMWEGVMHPEDYEKGRRTWADKKEVSSLTRERRLRHGETGEYRWHSGISIAMQDGDGATTSWNTYFVDIHARKLVEDTLRDNKELKDTQALLEEKIKLLNRSNQQLEQFAYIASHDLQEPLRKIGFYSDFLNKKYAKALPEEASVFFENMVRSTDRMKALIKDVLAYSTVRRDNFTNVSLAKIAADALEDIEISIQEKNAEVHVDELPDITGNATQLKQLFENLLSNALKFSKPDDRPVIHIKSDVSGDLVRLRFEDNGIGFDEQYMGKMFDLFQRLHTKDKYGGTGIGLALCKKIVDVHGGQLLATSAAGNGAVFSITLPIKQNEVLAG